MNAAPHPPEAPAARPAETALTGNRVPTEQEILDQVGRVVSHPIFRKSESLRNILTFLAQALIESPGANHKEHEIATRALGRSEDFDPRLDSSVRVQTARLRTKLAEYYTAYEKNDRIILEIPKGAYQLSARYLESVSSEPAYQTPPQPAPAKARGRAIWIGAATGVVLLALAVWLLHALENRPPEGLRTFWSDFTDPGKELTLVFPNIPLAGSAEEGLRYRPLATVSPKEVNENYAGTGEVYGVGALAALFAQYWKPAHIKCGRLLTWDDARQRNLVFVGGPDVNPQLGELPSLQRFRFGPTDAGAKWNAWIDDLQSPLHRPVRYAHSERPYTFDYSIIAMMHLNGRKILLLAGTTTIGTQAAADFVTHEESIERLLSRLPVVHGTVPDFEALLKVKIHDDVPLRSDILDAYLRK